MLHSLIVVCYDPAMARDPIANDNSEDEDGINHAEMDYVRDRVLELLQELEEDGIGHINVAGGAAEAIADFVPGDLDCDASGVGDLWSGSIDLSNAIATLKRVRQALEVRALKLESERPGIRLYKDVGTYSATHDV